MPSHASSYILLGCPFDIRKLEREFMTGEEEPESSGGICDLLTSTSVPSRQKVEGYKNSPIRQLATAKGRGPINYKHRAY